MSEGLTIAVVAGIFGVLAGVPAAISAYLSHKTRQENTDQHGESQRRLEELNDSVKETGGKVDGLAHRIDRLDGKHDDIPEQAFLMVGTIEDAVKKAERLAAEAA
jgi:F0F1-type ATP synthase beta subunit